MKREFTLFFVLFSLFSLSAPTYSSKVFNGIKNVILPSGDVIEVIAPMLLMKYEDGSTTLRLRYITKINLEDTTAIKNEADSVWEVFKHKAAIMSVYKPWEGEFKKSRHKGYMFRLQQQPDGEWVYQNRIEDTYLYNQTLSNL